VSSKQWALILLALSETASKFKPGDRIVLCAIGAGTIKAAITLQW